MSGSNDTKSMERNYSQICGDKPMISMSPQSKSSRVMHALHRQEEEPAHSSCNPFSAREDGGFLLPIVLFQK